MSFSKTTAKMIAAGLMIVAAACKESTNNAPMPTAPALDPIDTAYTHLEKGIHIQLMNRSDALPEWVDLDIYKKDWNITYANSYTAHNGREDSLKFNGNQKFITAPPIGHTDSTVTFISTDVDRIKIDHIVAPTGVHILKPFNKSTTLVIEWRINDITEPYDPQKEIQRANTIINNIGKMRFTAGHL